MTRTSESERVVLFLVPYELWWLPVVLITSIIFWADFSFWSIFDIFEGQSYLEIHSLIFMMLKRRVLIEFE